MRSSTEKYSLLSSSDTVEDHAVASEAVPKHCLSSGHWARTSFGALILILMISLGTNVFFMVRSLAYKWGITGNEEASHYEAANTSLYSHLPRDPDVPFPWSTGYGPDVNWTLADERWEAIDIDPGVIAIPDEWAAAHNLPPTQRFPWDQSKGIYAITAFHTLHCLKVLHRILYDVHLGRPPTRDVSHGMHCLDHLRKDTMCNADDYLLSTPPGVYGRDGPRGQARQCRDWDAFVDWSKGFNSCYRHITDDEVYYHKHYRAIDRYSICPEDSPYFQKAQAYLKTHRGGSVTAEQKRSDSPDAEEVWPAL